MKGSTVLVALAAFVSSVSAVAGVEKRATTISNPNTPPVTIRGNAFYANGKRFFIRGVDYQPGGASLQADPIADIAGCTRDVAKFKELGINTIRVYTVDNSKNHDACMKLLADAGIYLALDVNSPLYSLNRASERDIQISYNAVYLQFVFSTIDVFSKYDNTLLFYSANEVINDAQTSFSAPYIKAVTRDMRGYIKARGYRPIPVGYSAADVDENRLQMALYMNCGTDDIRSDFYTFNDYSYCSPSSYETSGWNQKVATYSNYSLPLFLSELGCNTNKRDFGEIELLYSSKMTPVYSGGLVYEYTMESNNYGLVQVNGNSVQELDDFKTLKNQYAANPVPEGDGGAKANGAASQCPAYSPPNWVVQDNRLPALPSAAQKYYLSGAGTPVGLGNRVGSQTSGSAGDTRSNDSGIPNSTNSTNNSGTTGGGIKREASLVLGSVLIAITLIVL